ncbi:MAG TPA: alpha/beta hydrolase [Spirochaetia bacterium]|nr:alpha/beta hydrolase [Spirochaetia bacterium]
MNWSSGIARTGGLKIHYFRNEGKREGTPPIVLAHGLTDNGRCWNRLASVISGDYDLIAVEARGHGLSDKPREGYSVSDHAQDLADCIRTLDLKAPALIGHSMGADNVAYLAATAPDLVSCLILEDPPWRPLGRFDPPREEVERRAEEWREQILKRHRCSLEELAGQARKEHPSWDESELEPWAEGKLQVYPEVLEYILKRADWSDFVPGIRCPTLLISGDPDSGAIVTPAIAEKICSLNRNIRVVRIEGAGHSIRRERFGEYADTVKDFLSYEYQEQK